MDILYSIYAYFYNWFYTDHNFINPFDHIKNFEDTDEFSKFKNEPEDFSKLMFALNNIPNKIFNLLFNKYDNVCQEYYHVTMVKNKNSKIYQITQQNLDNINEHLINDSIRYIYIRIDLINNHRKGNIHHVNSIVIDREKKYVLFFEPKVNLKYNKQTIIDLINLDDYQYLEPKDVGYHIFNKLQTVDCFCQTYILYTYILIIENNDVEFENFSRMFNSIISTKNIGYFLFYIFQKYKVSDLEVGINPTEWNFPKSGINKIFDTLRLQLKSALEDNNYEEEYDGFDIIDEDGYVIATIKSEN